MMLTGLQNPSKTLPLDGTLGKPQPLDSETIQPVSFGEILKLKEKQLQQAQEVSASSIAAALAALQTLSIASLPMPEMETVQADESTAKVEASSSSGNVLPVPADNSIGISETPIDAKQATARLVTAGAADPAPETSPALAAPVASKELIAQIEPQQMQSVPAGLLQTQKSETPAPSIVAVNERLTEGVVPTSFSETVRVRVDMSGDKRASQSLDGQAYATVSEARGSQPTIKTETGAEVNVEQAPATAEVQAPSAYSFVQNTKATDVAPQDTEPKVPVDVPEPSVFVEKLPSSPTLTSPMQTANEDQIPADQAASKPATEQRVTAATLPIAEAEFTPANSAGETRGPAVEVASQVEVETQSLSNTTRTIASTVQHEQSESITLPVEAEMDQGISVPRTISTATQASVSQHDPDLVTVDGKTIDELRTPQMVTAKPPTTIDRSTEMPAASQKPSPVTTSFVRPQPATSEAGTQNIENGSSTATVAYAADVPESKPAVSTTGFKFEEASTSPVHHPDAPVNDVQPASDEIRTGSQENPSTPSFGTEQLPSDFAIVEEEALANKQSNTSVAKADIQGNNDALVRTETNVAFMGIPASQSSTERTINVEAQAEIETGETAASVPESALSRTSTTINQNGMPAEPEQLRTDTTLVSNDVSSPELASTVPLQMGTTSETNPEAARTEPFVSSQQGATKPVQSEKVSPDAMGSDITPPSLQPGEKPLVDHKASEKAPQTGVQDATTSTGSSVDQVTPLAPSVSRVEAPKETLKTKQADKEETVEPVGKQPKTNQMSGTTAQANGPVNEPVAAEQSRDIPVGQVDAQAAEVAQQVIRHLRSNIKSGPTSMHLQLNPKELGVIDVQMVSSSEGLHVTFFAEQLNTGKLLESQLPQLRESLMDSGVQLSGLNISQHNQSGQKGETFGQNTNFAQTSQRDFPQAKTSHQEVSPAERRTWKSSEVDYLI